MDSKRSCTKYNAKQNPCGDVESSVLSPRYYSLHSMLGKSARAGPLNCNLQRHVIEKRLKNIRISWRHQIPFLSSMVSGIQSMDMDPVDNRFLLCGSCRGEMSFVDLERPLPADSRSVVNHRVIPCTSSQKSHRSLITRCQWYPQDTSAFISSCKNGEVKLWDTNRKVVVDEYLFDRAVTDMHWCNAVVRNALIAVATLTSNIGVVDPRIGDLSHNLMWSEEQTSSVRWSVENGNILVSGGRCGNIAVWDIRSSKSCLKSMKSSNSDRKNSGPACIGGLRFSGDGIHLVSFSTGGIFTVWRAHTMEMMNCISLGSKYRICKDPTVHFDIFSDDGILRACLPSGLDVLILGLMEKEQENAFTVLSNHLQPVMACVYRQKYHQVISSGKDRVVHIWSPLMDEFLPDGLFGKITLLRTDQWSDDELQAGPSYA